MEREGKTSPEEIAKLWNNLAAKAMEGIREVEELERRFEEGEEEEEGEKEPQVISSEEEDDEVEIVDIEKKEEKKRPGGLQWGQWFKKARLQIMRVVEEEKKKLES